MSADRDKQTAETGREQPSRSVSPYKAGLKCTCPRCGEGALYEPGTAGMLKVRATCAACGFDLSAADPGDGAQVFVILIMGALCAILGMFLVGAMGLNKGVAVAILFAFILVGSLWMLRVFKATLIALQFHHDAREGRMKDDDA